jgi:hypothetical protein
MSEFGWNWKGNGSGETNCLNRKASEKQRGADQPSGENHHALTSKHDTDAIDHERASELRRLKRGSASLSVAMSSQHRTQ